MGSVDYQLAGSRFDLGRASLCFELHFTIDGRLELSDNSTLSFQRIFVLLLCGVGHRGHKKSGQLVTRNEMHGSTPKLQLLQLRTHQ